MQGVCENNQTAIIDEEEQLKRVLEASMKETYSFSTQENELTEEEIKALGLDEIESQPSNHDTSLNNQVVPIFPEPKDMTKKPEKASPQLDANNSLQKAPPASITASSPLSDLFSLFPALCPALVRDIHDNCQGDSLMASAVLAGMVADMGEIQDIEDKTQTEELKNESQKSGQDDGSARSCMSQEQSVGISKNTSPSSPSNPSTLSNPVESSSDEVVFIQEPNMDEYDEGIVEPPTRSTNIDDRKDFLYIAPRKPQPLGTVSDGKQPPTSQLPFDWSQGPGYGSFWPTQNQRKFF